MVRAAGGVHKLEIGTPGDGRFGTGGGRGMEEAAGEGLFLGAGEGVGGSYWRHVR